MTGKTISPWARGGATGGGGAAGGRAVDAAARSSNVDNPLAGIPGLFKGPRRAHRRDRPEHRRAPLDDSARRHGAGTGRVPQQPAAEGAEGRHQLGPPRPCRDDGDADAAVRDRPRRPTARPHLFAIDKKTGKRVGAVPTPRDGRYGLMTYMHQGKQYVMLPVNGGYTALALP